MNTTIDTAHRAHAPAPTAADRYAIACEQVYAFECALHTAHQAQASAEAQLEAAAVWVTAASDRLHEALSEYLAARAQLNPEGRQ